MIRNMFYVNFIKRIGMKKLLVELKETPQPYVQVNDREVPTNANVTREEHSHKQYTSK